MMSRYLSLSLCLSEPVEERLDVHLESRHWHVDVEALRVDDFGVENAYDSKCNALADDVCLHAREERRVLAGHQLEGSSLRLLLVFVLGFARESVHDLINNAVQLLELRAAGGIYCADASHIPRHGLLGGVLNDDIAHLEEFDR